MFCLRLLLWLYGIGPGYLLVRVGRGVEGLHWLECVCVCVVLLGLVGIGVSVFGLGSMLFAVFLSLVMRLSCLVSDFVI